MASRMQRRGAAFGALLLVFALGLGGVFARALWINSDAALGYGETSKQTLRIIAVGEPEWTLMRLLQPYLDSPAFKALQLPPVHVDWIGHSSADQVVKDLRRLLDRGQKYQAILVASVSTARLVQLETRDTPIIFEGVDNALKRCLVDDLKRPGRNATGYMHVLDEHPARMMQVLHDAFPALNEIVVLVSADNRMLQDCASPLPSPEGTECQARLHVPSPYLESLIEPAIYLATGARMGLRVRFFVVCRAWDIAALRGLVPSNTGVLLPWQDLFAENEANVVAALQQIQLPAIGGRESFAMAGGLMALWVQVPQAPPRDSLRLLGQVLGGQSPAVLPVSMPGSMRLTVNASAAREQNLRPTLAVWRRADRVVP